MRIRPSPAERREQFGGGSAATTRRAEKLRFSENYSNKTCGYAAVQIGGIAAPSIAGLPGKAQPFRSIWQIRVHKPLWLFLLIFLLSCVVVAQPTTAPPPLNSHRWGSISAFNGLPSDSVRAIAQTPDGVLWFGTDNGLARSDGRGVQPIAIGEGDANRVLALKVDPASGKLWIGTQNGAFIYARNEPELVPDTAGAAINCMWFDATQSLLGADNGTVLVATPASTQRLVPDQLVDAQNAPLRVTSIVRAGGRLFVGTIGKGVLEYVDGRFAELTFIGRPLAVNVLAVGRNGELWIGAEAPKGQSGIFRYDLASGNGERISASSAVVFGLEVDYQGIWAGTARYGLFRYTPRKPIENSTFENTSGGLRANTVFSIFTDREGVRWFGTNRGVSRYDERAAFQTPVSDVPNRNFIRTLWQSGDGRFMLAGSNRGLLTLSGSDWKPLPTLSEKAIYAIGRSGHIVGTPNGVFDTNGHLLTEGDSRGIETYKGKTYAAIVGRGIVDLDGKNVLFDDGTVNSMLSRPDKLWIGTSGHGLFSFDGNSIKSEAPPDQLKSGAIWRIFASADNSLWLAAQHGVFRLNDGTSEQIIAAEDVRDVMTDGPDVWAATATRGVLHARYDDRFGWLTSSIGFEQGLPSDKAFSIIKMPDRWLFATNRGIVSYYPHNFTPGLIVTRVLSQRIHGSDEVTARIELDYPQKSLLVEVSGLSSRTFPEEFQYAFTLTNAKGEVVDRRIGYSPQYSPADLASGDYAIEAIAFDRDLNASEPVAVRFSVAKAPFPRTATALGVLLFIAIVGLVWAFVEHRRMRQRNRELAAARLDLANEAERERRRIARDLHDQTLADLRNLMMMSDKLTPEHPEFRDEIETVSSEIRRICEDLSPSVLENVGLVAALQFVLEHTVENCQFTAAEDLEERIDLPINVQLQIYRIAQEVLANIKRHSDADHVEMSVETRPSARLLLTITDNGRAFSPDAQTKRGRGIANIKARASLINAKVVWKERSSGGNRFFLTIG